MRERDRESEREAANRLEEIDADCLRNKQPLRARVTETQCSAIAINFSSKKAENSSLRSILLLLLLLL